MLTVFLAAASGKRPPLPFTANQPEAAPLFVSLLLRPLVCPEIEGQGTRTMEARFFAPGGLVSNLDFVEGIFGKANDPFLPETDAALVFEACAGHPGCVILARHLARLGQCDVGLPRYDRATERQRLMRIRTARETPRSLPGPNPLSLPA